MIILSTNKSVKIFSTQTCYWDKSFNFFEEQWRDEAVDHEMDLLKDEVNTNETYLLPSLRNTTLKKYPNKKINIDK